MSRQHQQHYPGYPPGSYPQQYVQADWSRYNQFAQPYLTEASYDQSYHQQAGYNQHWPHGQTSGTYRGGYQPQPSLTPDARWRSPPSWRERRPNRTQPSPIASPEWGPLSRAARPAPATVTPPARPASLPPRAVSLTPPPKIQGVAEASTSNLLGLDYSSSEDSAHSDGSLQGGDGHPASKEKSEGQDTIDTLIYEAGRRRLFLLERDGGADTAAAVQSSLDKAAQAAEPAEPGGRDATEATSPVASEGVEMKPLEEVAAPQDTLADAEPTAEEPISTPPPEEQSAALKSDEESGLERVGGLVTDMGSEGQQAGASAAEIAAAVDPLGEERPETSHAEIAEEPVPAADPESSSEKDTLDVQPQPEPRANDVMPLGTPDCADEPSEREADLERLRAPVPEAPEAPEPDHEACNSERAQIVAEESSCLSPNVSEYEPKPSEEEAAGKADSDSQPGPRKGPGATKGRGRGRAKVSKGRGQPTSAKQPQPEAEPQSKLTVRVLASTPAHQAPAAQGEKLPKEKPGRQPRGRKGLGKQEPQAAASKTRGAASKTTGAASGRDVKGQQVDKVAKALRKLETESGVEVEALGLGLRKRRPSIVYKEWISGSRSEDSAREEKEDGESQAPQKKQRRAASSARSPPETPLARKEEVRCLRSRKRGKTQLAPEAGEKPDAPQPEEQQPTAPPNKKQKREQPAAVHLLLNAKSRSLGSAATGRGKGRPSRLSKASGSTAKASGSTAKAAESTPAAVENASEQEPVAAQEEPRIQEEESVAHDEPAGEVTHGDSAPDDVDPVVANVPDQLPTTVAESADLPAPVAETVQDPAPVETADPSIVEAEPRKFTSADNFLDQILQGVDIETLFPDDWAWDDDFKDLVRKETQALLETQLKAEAAKQDVEIEKAKCEEVKRREMLKIEAERKKLEAALSSSAAIVDSRRSEHQELKKAMEALEASLEDQRALLTAAEEAAEKDVHDAMTRLGLVYT